MNRMAKVVYLLGAGFTSGMTEGKAPLTKQVGEEIGKIFPFEIKNKFNFSPENIELFLTHVDLEIFRNGDPELKKQRKSVGTKIQELLHTRKFFNPDNQIDLTQTAKRVSSLLFKKDDVILTLNYDLYLENALLSNKKWTTMGGWEEMDFEGDDWNETMFFNIKIFKLHGSINFILVAPINDDTHLSLHCVVDKDLFPQHYENTSWQGQRGTYLVTPSYVKLFHQKIYRLWNKAVLVLQEADRVVLIGTSLREEDFQLNFILSFIKPESKIFIIDPYADQIKEKIIRNIPISTKISIISHQIPLEELSEEIVEEIYNQEK